MSKTLMARYGIFVFAAFIAAGIALWWINHGHAWSNSSEGARVHSRADQSNSAPTRVETVKPTRGGIPRKSRQPGTIEAFNFADLFAKVSGYLKKQPVDIGDTVKAGQVIAEIDAPEFVQQLANAKAALAEAESQVKLAQVKVQTAQAEAEAADAAVEEAESDVLKETANLKFREQQYERIKHLFELKSIEERLVDEKDEQRHAARAAESSARSAVVNAKAQAGAARARVDQARAEVDAAKSKADVAAAAVGKAQVFVDYTRIVSPYDGVVTRRSFHVGDFVRAAEDGGIRPMFSVAKIDVMRVVVQVPERDAAATNAGDAAVVELDAIPDRKFEAKVARIANSEDRASRTMRTEIDLKNDENELRDGMFGRVTISLKKSTRGLTLPSSCVLGNDEGTESWVFVVRDGKALRKSVETGFDNGVRVEIRSGISAEESVIERPGADLADGTPVEVEQPHRARHENQES
ncbi:MAG TPA: efflux RND transporter periplasmic adaptor subunit [Planctomycetaceae bacterium]|nr:efflux RND transporter periplasmic adaptor subunit [Planctomycetaceae bacterium]